MPDLGGPGHVCGGTAGWGRFALRSHAGGLEKKKPRDERGFDRPDRWRGTIWGVREDPVARVQRGRIDFSSVCDTAARHPLRPHRREPVPSLTSPGGDPERVATVEFLPRQ